jgi:hypothetical protein
MNKSSLYCNKSATSKEVKRYGFKIKSKKLKSDIPAVFIALKKMKHQ